MKKYAKSSLHGFVVGTLITLVVAVLPTFLDWRQNLSGIFQGSAGTNWDVVFETFFSWLWPTFLVAVPVSILVFVLVAERRSSDAT